MVAPIKNVANNTVIISPKLQESKYLSTTYVGIYRSTFSTAATIVANCHLSNHCRCFCNFGTCNTHCSAYISLESAGASLTPSPVTHNSIVLCHALTILTLCSGDTLAYTLIFLTFSASSSSLMFSSSSGNHFFSLV